MKITDETLDHLAALSRLVLTDSERKSLKTDLNNILVYVEKLDNLDVKDVQPTFQVTDLENVWRPDEIETQDASPDDLLALSKDVSNHQIKVPKVL